MSARRAKRDELAGKPSGSPSDTERLPRWVAPTLYALATLVLFRKFVVSDAMLFGSDTLSLGYVARAFYAESLRSGTFPLWNPRILGGTPFIDSLAGGDSLYPTSLLLLIMETYRALGWKLVLHVFLAGLFMYGWARTLGVSRLASLVAGLAYLMAPFMVSLVFPGHDGKLFVTALTPLLFWLAERTLSGGGLGRYAVLALAIGLVILTTHFQAAYFLFGALGLYYLVRCVDVWRCDGAPRAARALVLFLLATVMGAGVSSVQLLPAVRYVTEYSRRTQTTTAASPEAALEYGSSWGLHPEEVAGLIVPEFVGSDVGGAAWASNTYWGRNVFKHNHEYAGLVALILASLAFLGGRRPVVRWFMLGLGAISILFGLGLHTPVWRLFFRFVPGISLFRAPSIAAFLFGFAAITLLALGLDRLLEADPRHASGGKGLQRVALGWTVALAALALLAASGALLDLWTSLVYSDIEPAKAAILQASRGFITRGFVLSTLLAGGVLAVAWARGSGRMGRAAAAAAIALLVALDVGRVDDPFIQTFDFRQWAAPDRAVAYLQGRLQAEAPFRVFSMMDGLGQDVKPSMYGLELAAGHHPNDFGRYRELIGMQGSGLPRRLFESPNILPILNVRYLLWPVAQMGPLEQLEELPHLQRLRRVAESTLPDGRVFAAVYAFPGLPRARLVGEATVVPDEQAVATLADPAFDPALQVVLSEPPPIELPGEPVSGTVSWVERETNRKALDVEAAAPSLLVIADNWFPAWKARVDGADVPLIRANYVQQAVALTPGSHRVEIYYSSQILRRALLLSVTSLVLLAAVTFTGRIRSRRAQAAGDTGPEPVSPDSDTA